MGPLSRVSATSSLVWDQYRLPPFDAEEWLEKKVETNEEEKSTREEILQQLWVSRERDFLGFCVARDSTVDLQRCRESEHNLKKKRKDFFSLCFSLLFFSQNFFRERENEFFFKERFLSIKR